MRKLEIISRNKKDKSAYNVKERILLENDGGSYEDFYYNNRI